MKNKNQRSCDSAGPETDWDDGNDEFIAKLLNHRHRIIAFIAKQLVNRADVEDVFQKTCTIMWKKNASLDKDSSFFNWACGIAFNEIRNHITKLRRDRLTFDEELMDLLASEAAEEEAISKARLTALERCVEKLSQNQQILVRQCYITGDSITEFASKNKVSRGALYKQLARIRQKLLECIRSRLLLEGTEG